MKAWREVARPHADVREGRFRQADFAADLSKVAEGTATPEYQDPAAFFERTYVTEGMKQLLVAVAQRLNGCGGEPVVELKTNFGGGKTHALLAVFHMATYPGQKVDLLGMASVLESAGVEDVPSAKVAVIDGNALAPNQPMRKGGLSLRTLWGNLAWQLLGTRGYERVAESDRSGTSPGRALLEGILRDAGPCAILLDELVAYYRQLDAQALTGGTFESNVSFAQALTEAVKAVPTAVLLVSLPSSDTEAAGTFGRSALETLEQTFGRLQAVWRPVSAEEGFAIVKRRLFEEISDTEGMEETCRKFGDYYHEKRDSLPDEVQDGRWAEKMRQCYPIHPEVFARLYEDWSTLPNFQKTRGVLQYMATIIHRLWEDGTEEPLILPGSIPLRDRDVANKTSQFLPNGWAAIIDREIDGENSYPVRLDAQDPRFGPLHAAVRVARTIFLGSAASSSAQAVRGVDFRRICLGCALPGQELSFYQDALARLKDSLQYLFTGNDHYWFDTRPNLRRTMEECKRRITEGEVRDCLGRAVREKWGNPASVIVGHIFEDHRNIPDDITDRIRVVVLPPEKAYSPVDNGKNAFLAAETFLDKHGTQARQRKNRLVFLTPEIGAARRIEEECRTVLAWRAVREGIANGSLNVTQQEKSQVVNAEQSATELLRGLIGEGFTYLLVPVSNGAGRVGFEAHRMPPAAMDSLGETARRTLLQNEYIVDNWASQFLQSSLEESWFRNGETEASTRRVWLDMASFLEFQRIVSSGVFCDTVRRGVAEGRFGYARGKTDDGKYVGFKYREEPGMVGISDGELLIQGAAAEKYLATQSEATPTTTATGEIPDRGTSGETGGGSAASPATSTGGGVPPPPLPTPARRVFAGTVQIDASRDTDGLRQVAEEILEHLARSGARVTVRLEIQARNVNPFPPALVRTVGENARALGFERTEFS